MEDRSNTLSIYFTNDIRKPNAEAQRTQLSDMESMLLYYTKVLLASFKNKDVKSVENSLVYD